MGETLDTNRMASRALDALSLGVVVTDRQSRRIYANTQADSLLAGGGALMMICGDRIGSATLETQKLLHAAIERVCARPGEAESHHVLACAADGRRPDLAVCIAPVPVGVGDVAAMILMRVIERECDVEIEGRRLFGLTRMEAKFASAIASGRSLAEAAQHHAVSMATARSHMKNIFRKTGVCRQSQVAALMRGAQTPIQRSSPVGAKASPRRLRSSVNAATIQATAAPIRVPSRSPP